MEKCRLRSTTVQKRNIWRKHDASVVTKGKLHVNNQNRDFFQKLDQPRLQMLAQVSKETSVQLSHPEINTENEEVMEVKWREWSDGLRLERDQSWLSLQTPAGPLQIYHPLMEHEAISTSESFRVITLPVNYRETLPFRKSLLHLPVF